MNDVIRIRLTDKDGNPGISVALRDHGCWERAARTARRDALEIGQDCYMGFMVHSHIICRAAGELRHRDFGRNNVMNRHNRRRVLRLLAQA